MLQTGCFEGSGFRDSGLQIQGLLGFGLKGVAFSFGCGLGIFQDLTVELCESQFSCFPHDRPSGPKKGVTAGENSLA